MSEEMTRQLYQAQLRIAELERQISDSTFGSSIAEAAARNGVRPEAIEDFTARVQKAFKAEGSALVPRESSGPDLATFVMNLGERAPHLFTKSAASTGQPGHTVRQGGEELDANPFVEGHLNLTRAAHLAKTNPVLAERLKSEARTHGRLAKGFE